MVRKTEFTKKLGAGNDYIHVHALRCPFKSSEHLSELWSNHHKGIGGNVSVLIGPAKGGDFSTGFFNNEDSEARTCGNALRCNIVFAPILPDGATLAGGYRESDGHVLLTGPAMQVVNGSSEHSEQ